MYNSIANNSNFKNILLYLLVSLFLIFEMAVQVSPSVMTTYLMHDLHISEFGLGMMSGVYFYTYTCMQIPSGLLFDKYHPRIIITLSILTCCLGILLFAYVENIYLGSIARLLMGLGSAFAFVSVLVVTAELFPSKYFATMTGVTQMLAAFGAMTGQLPISELVVCIGWRHTLYLLFLIGVVLALLIWKLLKYERNSNNLLQPQVSFLSLKNVVSQSQTWLVALYACLLWAPMSCFASLWGVPFLMYVHHISQTKAAFLCSLMWLGLAIGSPLLGMLGSAMRNLVFPLAISALLGIIAFNYVLDGNISTTLLGVFLLLAGAACSGQALSFALVKDNHSSDVKGIAIAFNNMAVVISGAVFQPLIGDLIDLHNPMQFKNGLYIILFAYIIAFIIAYFFIKETNSKNRTLHIIIKDLFTKHPDSINETLG